MSSACASAPTACVGVANVDLTAEMALAIGRACVRVFSSPKVMLGRDTRRLGPDVRVRDRGGCVLGRRRRGVARGGTHPHRRRRLRPRRRSRGRDLGQPQPLRRQRDQDLRPGRPQADRCRAARGRGRDRRGPRRRPPRRARREPGSGRSSPIRRWSTPTPTRVDRRGGGSHPGRAQGRGGLRQRSSVDGRARHPPPARCRHHGHRRSPRRRATSTSGCGSTHPDELQTAVAARGADLGVAFDGDADRVLAVDGRGDARRRRPDHRPVRHRPAGPRPASRERHGRGDRDVEPRVPPGDGEAGRHGRRHRRGRPLRPRGARRRWLHARRGAVGPHHLPGPRRPRATASCPRSCWPTSSSVRVGRCPN